MQQEFKTKLLAGEKFHCECCDRYAQVYERKIHHSMAAKLIKFYRAGAHLKWMPTSVVSSKTGPNDFTMLRHWGLIQRHQNDGPNDPNAGLWCITDLGVQYVLGDVKVPYVASVYNDRVLEFSERLCDIKQALAEKFDYDQLMGRAYA